MSEDDYGPFAWQHVYKVCRKHKKKLVVEEAE